MTLDLSSIEAVWVVLGEAGIDTIPWFVCFTTNEADALRAIAVCERDVASLTQDERDTLFDSYADSVKPELAPVIERRRAKLTLDKNYAGSDGNGATYRYERLDRWPSYGQRVDERSGRPR